MHTYRIKDSGLAEVFFEQDECYRVLARYNDELYAAMYVHYLNGGELGPMSVQTLLDLRRK